MVISEKGWNSILRFLSFSKGKTKRDYSICLISGHPDVCRNIHRSSYLSGCSQCIMNKSYKDFKNLIRSIRLSILFFEDGENARTLLLNLIDSAKNFCYLTYNDKEYHDDKNIIGDISIQEQLEILNELEKNV